MPIDLHPRKPTDEPTLEDAQNISDLIDGVLSVMYGAAAFLTLTFLPLDIPEDPLLSFRIIMLLVFTMGVLALSACCDRIARAAPDPGP